MHIRIHYTQALLTASVEKELQKRLRKPWISSRTVAIPLSFISWAANKSKLSFI